MITFMLASTIARVFTAATQAITVRGATALSRLVGLNLFKGEVDLDVGSCGLHQIVLISSLLGSPICFFICLHSCSNYVTCG